MDCADAQSRSSTIYHLDWHHSLRLVPSILKSRATTVMLQSLSPKKEPLRR